MKNERTIEILKTAILMERKGQAFYRQVAEQTKSPEVKSLFETMAKEEILHERFLADQFKEYTQNNKLITQDLPLDDNQIVGKIITSKIIKDISAASYEAVAISAAMDMESNAIKVYANFAKESTDPQEKELFNWLSEWEKGHHKILLELDNDLKENIWNDNQFWPF